MKRIILSVLMCITASCGYKSSLKVETTPSDNKGPAEIQEGLLNNDYTNIVLSLCDRPRSEHRFTVTNTTCFDLFPFKALECFAFCSEGDCLASHGSCGYNIMVIQKTAIGYRKVFSACGSDLTPCFESHYGYTTFTYTDKLGYTYKVSFSGKGFEQVPTTINTLDYRKMKVIAELTNNDIGFFIPEENDSSDNHHARVRVEKITIGKDKNAELFTVGVIPEQYFLFYENRLLLTVTELMSLEAIPDNSKSFYDIKVYRISDYYPRDSDRSSYFPTRYRYSTPLHHYQKQAENKLFRR